MAKRRQRKKHPVKSREIKLLLISVVLLSLAGISVFVFQNFNELVYPQLHKNQVSPKQVISERAPQLIQDGIPQVIEHGSRYQYKIALTFDADMTPAMQKLLRVGLVKSWYNQAIEQTLDKENVKATIFFTGLWVETYPQEAKALASDPLIEIGNHSYSHPAFTKNCYRLPFIDDAGDKNEVLSAQDAIKKVTGITSKYFRFPGGCFDTNDLKTVSDLGLKVIHWDIVAGDGFNKNIDDIINRVESRVQNGSIVVFHLQGGSFAPKTNDALVKIIPYLKKRGYQMVTISELLNESKQ